MRIKSIFKVLLVLLIILAMIGGYDKGKCADSSATATVEFVVILNDGSTPEEVPGTKKYKNKGCFLDALKRDYRAFADASLSNYNREDVASVTLTISSEGLDTPIEIVLSQSAPGEPYTGSHTDLPPDVELTFDGVAKNESGEIIFEGSAIAILEANKVVTIVITLSPVCSICTDWLPIIVLKTSHGQIVPDGTATIEIKIGDDNDDEVLCEISHCSEKGSLSNTGSLITLENHRAQIETILTPDSSGGYSDTVTVKIDDQHGGFAVASITIEILSAQSAGAHAAVNFAPVITSISIEDNGDNTMTVTAILGDERDSANFVYRWEGEITFVGADNANPIIIEQPPASILVVLTVTNEENCTSSTAFYISPNNFEPLIAFTYVPPFGSFNNLEGIVKNVAQEDYKIAVFIKVSNGWWTKPYWNSPLITVNEDLTWSCDITTGGNDQDATHIEAFIVPNEWPPVTLGGETAIPQEVYDSALTFVSVAREMNYRTILFSGYEWTVKTSSSKLGPGPNYFSDSNDSVWVDDNGFLHLTITQRESKWYCSEVICNQSLGHGKYIFYLGSRVDQLDKNVTLGLFTWDNDPADNHREIDIEFAKWGDANTPIAQYVIQPYYYNGNRYRFDMELIDSNSIHYFEWGSDNIFFKSISGTDLDGPEIDSYNYTGSSNPTPGNENPRINLWLQGGSYLPPSDGEDVEVIVKKFGYIP
ncbi:MAG: hypothetical protein ACMUJM_15160 [bacterium]